jgi:hypothetical protein
MYACPYVYVYIYDPFHTACTLIQQSSIPSHLSISRLGLILVISVAFHYLCGFFFLTYASLAGLRFTCRG